MPKYALDCPLCSVIMKQHPAGYFICPECSGMFSCYRGPDKADLLAGLLADHRVKPKPRRKPASDTLNCAARPVHKRGDKEGFVCLCGEFKPFNSYIYAHMADRLTHTCESCGAKFRIHHGIVTVIEKPNQALHSK